MEHRYSKLEIPTQYFQEHFASFPKISFKRSLFLWFSHTLFSASFMQVFFSFFYNFICIQWISLVKNPLSVFPIACVSLRKEIIYATKKFYVATKCKATSKVPKQFLYFFYDPEKTFTVVYLFWCRFKWNVSVIITLQFCFIRLDWRSMT